MLRWHSLLRILVVLSCCPGLAQAQEKPGRSDPLRAAGNLRAGEAAATHRNLGVSGSEKRVALVVGNSAYPGLAALKNPVNDANDMAAKLGKMGFDVTLKTDVPLRDMLRTLTDFGDKIQPGGEALFFYAGHGMQVRGKNYLIPVDAAIRTESSVSSEAVDVDQLLDKLSPARLSLVILDACRNNPFERRFRGGGQGLAQVNAPTGTLIAYATAPGKVAADGEGRNGLYTAELLATMDAPGLKAEDVFKRVRANVVKKSGEVQIPWEASSLTGDFYFIFQGPTTVNAQPTPDDPEGALWAEVKASRAKEYYEAYLKSYPKGKYAALARVELDKAAEKAKEEAEREAATRPGAAFRDCPDCPEMVLIPAGSFEMGSPAAEAGRGADEGPQHRVSIPKPFALGRHEVTVEQFRAFVRISGYKTDAEKNAGGKDGCYARQDGKWDWRGGKYWDSLGFEQKGTQPAACISWNDAKAYVKWLADKTGKSYRLPSEAEWEYAARADTTTARYWGDNPNEACAHANVADRTKGPGGHGWNNKHECTDGHWFSAPVGGFKPNAFGLHDMLGNVWEWTEDCWNGGYNGAPTDGAAWSGGNCARRVLRGGSWSNSPQIVRAANRGWNVTTFRNDYFGFRPARMLP